MNKVAQCPGEHLFARDCLLCGSVGTIGGAIPTEIAAAYRVGGLDAVAALIWEGSDDYDYTRLAYRFRAYATHTGKRQTT